MSPRYVFPAMPVAEVFDRKLAINSIAGDRL
jgi:hypothetical protein